MRKQVEKFAEMMETKLQYHDYKGGWDNLSTTYLYERLLQECGELFVAIAEKRVNAIKYEAADVANFAMMIADVSSKLETGE